MAKVLTAEQVRELDEEEECRQYDILSAKVALAEGEVLLRKAEVDLYEATVMRVRAINKQKEGFFEENENGRQKYEVPIFDVLNKMYLEALDKHGGAELVAVMNERFHDRLQKASGSTDYLVNPNHLADRKDSQIFGCSIEVKDVDHDIRFVAKEDCYNNDNK